MVAGAAVYGPDGKCAGYVERLGIDTVKHKTPYFRMWQIAQKSSGNTRPRRLISLLDSWSSSSPYLLRIAALT
jgi:hypothetical protein